MEHSLELYGEKYTPSWVKENMTKGQPLSSGRRQWYVRGFSYGSVEQDRDVEKYALTRIVEALNKEDNFGASLELRDYWKDGNVKVRMEEEIKQGIYSLSHSMRYTSTKKFTGFYDENDPTFTITIPAEKCEEIKELIETYGLPPMKVHRLLGLECSFDQFCKYLKLNREGYLDEAFKHIAHKSRTDEGYIDYVRVGVEPIKDKHMNDFKITSEE